MMTFFAAVSLVVAVLCAVMPFVWSRRKEAAAALPGPAEEPPLPTTLRQLVPSPDIVMEAPPPLDPLPQLRGQPQLDPPAVDLGLIGVPEDKEAATEAIWRSVKQALAANARASRPS